MHLDLVKAAVLGIVEGLTEYLPVSSTGHLLLLEHLFGWGDDSFGKSFAILIQLGAILALLSIYFGRLWALAKAMFTQWEAARFVIGVLLAFLPAAIVGALAYRVIKSYLFDVRVVCISLVIGGLVLLWVDRMNLKARYHDATAFTLPMYLGIGIILLACKADDGRRVCVRGLQKPWRSRRERKRHGGRRRLHLLVHIRMDRRQDVPGLRAAAQLRAVCVVAYSRRWRRPVCALYSVEPSGDAATELTGPAKPPQI